MVGSERTRVVRRGPRQRSSGGQAQLELVASVPLLIAAAAVTLQLTAVGYAQTLADGSAEAAALAIAAGRAADASAAARTALPGWADDRARVDVDGGRVAVELRPPALLPGVGGRLEVRSSAWARAPTDAEVPE